MAVSFAGLFYLSLYLAAKLHVLDAKGEVWRSFVVMVPTLGAALITGTRIMDARHHPFDVLSGATLGMLVAWAAYRQYFPPVSETWRKGRAYPIRAWGRGPAPPPTPQITVDEDVQPLRQMGKPLGPIDEERGEATGIAVTTDGEHGGNVFRQQISNSQRRRQEHAPYGVDRSDTLASSNYRSDTLGSTYRSNTLDSSLSTKVNRYQNEMPTANPFAASAARQRRMESYDYSSSEDDEPYELQPTGGAYNPVSGRLTDTGYHPPQGISPNPTPPPPPVNTFVPPHANTMSPTGDLSDRRDVGPPPPPHAVGTTPQQI